MCLALMCKKDIYRHKGLALTCFQPEPNRHLHQRIKTSYSWYKWGRQRRDKEKKKKKGIKVSKRAIRSPYKESRSHGFLYPGYLIYAIPVHFTVTAIRSEPLHSLFIPCHKDWEWGDNPFFWNLSRPLEKKKLPCFIWKKWKRKKPPTILVAYK